MSRKRSAAKKRAAAAAANAAPAPSHPSDISTGVGRLSLEQNPRKRNIVKEFDSYFGNTSDLANWQRLCHDLGIEGELPSISKCKKALRGVWVNIYDFLDFKTHGTPFTRFGSERALAKYTMKEGKIYPKKKAKKDGPVRALLAHIFRN